MPKPIIKISLYKIKYINVWWTVTVEIDLNKNTKSIEIRSGSSKLNASSNKSLFETIVGCLNSYIDARRNNRKNHYMEFGICPACSELPNVKTSISKSLQIVYCKYCHGSRKILLKDVNKIKINLNTMVDCPGCDGSGWIHETRGGATLSGNCWDCKGLGKVKKNDLHKIKLKIKKRTQRQFKRKKRV